MISESAASASVKKRTPGWAHALETRTRVERRRDREEPGQAQQVGHEQEVAGERNQCRTAPHGEERERQARGGQADDRAGHEDRRRRAAINRPLVEQFPQLLVWQQPGRAMAAGKRRLGAVDDRQQ